jgi:hypothetical protein
LVAVILDIVFSLVREHFQVAVLVGALAALALLMAIRGLLEARRENPDQ